MARHYDIVELLPDDSLIWRGAVVGLENAIRKLEELAKETKNEVRVMHLETRTIIATMNGRSSFWSS
jgi:hypothetical protein